MLGERERREEAHRVIEKAERARQWIEAGSTHTRARSQSDIARRQRLVLRASSRPPLRRLEPAIARSDAACVKSNDRNNSNKKQQQDVMQGNKFSTCQRLGRQIFRDKIRIRAHPNTHKHVSSDHEHVHSKHALLSKHSIVGQVLVQVDTNTFEEFGVRCTLSELLGRDCSGFALRHAAFERPTVGDTSAAPGRPLKISARQGGPAADTRAGAVHQ